MSEEKVFYRVDGDWSAVTMFGPDNNHLIERLLALAITNEEARQRLLTIQIINENYRTDLLLREHELVEQSAAHVAATSKAQEELNMAKTARRQCSYCHRCDGNHTVACPKNYRYSTTSSHDN